MFNDEIKNGLMYMLDLVGFDYEADNLGEVVNMKRDELINMVSGFIDDAISNREPIDTVDFEIYNLLTSEVE